MRDLLEDQQHPDRGQQTLDDAGGKERGDEAGACDSQGNLNHTRHDHCEQERFERAERRDLRRYDGRQARGGSAHDGV